MSLQALTTITEVKKRIVLRADADRAWAAAWAAVDRVGRNLPEAKKKYVGRGKYETVTDDTTAQLRGLVDGAKRLLSASKTKLVSTGVLNENERRAVAGAVESAFRVVRLYADITKKTVWVEEFQASLNTVLSSVGKVTGGITKAAATTAAGAAVSVAAPIVASLSPLLIVAGVGLVAWVYLKGKVFSAVLP